MTPTAGLSPFEFRETLGRFASGITIITASEEGRRLGMTASAFVSVSLSPPLVMVSLDNAAHMRQVLAEGAMHFGVNILSSAQKPLSDHFAGRVSSNPDIPWFEHEGLPLIGNCIAQLVCRKEQVIECGDHTLFIGLVEYSRYTDDDPLIYFGGHYQELA